MKRGDKAQWSGTLEDSDGMVPSEPVTIIFTHYFGTTDHPEPWAKIMVNAHTRGVIFTCVPLSELAPVG